MKKMKTQNTLCNVVKIWLHNKCFENIFGDVNTSGQKLNICTCKTPIYTINKAVAIAKYIIMKHKNKIYGTVLTQNRT